MFFLEQKSADAVKEDTDTGRDLMDTLAANRERCVGMAPNMIGVKKRIIIVNMGIADVVMYNPVIVKKDTPYEAEEGCLSLDGVRPARRFDRIRVHLQTVHLLPDRDQQFRRIRGIFPDRQIQENAAQQSRSQDKNQQSVTDETTRRG